MKNWSIKPGKVPIRLMYLRTHGAYPKNLSTKLYSLINFIVNVYAICWFDIKKSNKFHHQQIYIYNMIDRIQKQPIEIQRITLKKPPVQCLCITSGECFIFNGEI